MNTIADCEPDWYDFGGGTMVAPSAPGVKDTKEKMVALWCARNGRAFYRVICGDGFDERKMVELKETHAPILLEFAEEHKNDPYENHWIRIDENATEVTV